MGGFVKFLDRGSAPYGCVINQPQASWLKAATYVCRISRGVTGLFCFMWWQLGALGWPEGSEMASPAWLAAGWEFSWDCWPGRGGGLSSPPCGLSVGLEPLAEERMLPGF